MRLDVYDSPLITTSSSQENKLIMNFYIEALQRIVVF